MTYWCSTGMSNLIWKAGFQSIQAEATPEPTESQDQLIKSGVV